MIVQEDFMVLDLMVVQVVDYGVIFPASGLYAQIITQPSTKDHLQDGLITYEYGGGSD